MRALVTGAAGFIGSNVVRALVDRGHDVRAMTLPHEDTRNLRGLAVERLEGDVTDGDCMARAVRGVEVVFHLAAVFSLWERDAERMRRVNVD
ncbi:MAG: NAD-dependent epimerase/dehydratase family protein, partial [Myxococcales bacterium]|nr:NAD-dependent epimerase/dehydratase family protein [Myxococcales bacterium]